MNHSTIDLKVLAIQILYFKPRWNHLIRKHAIKYSLQAN